jgi:uncharacterized protein with PIN domain
VTDRIKFYTDEHVAKAVAAGLRRRGVDVLTAPEAGLHPAADEDHLALAVQQGRVIFTQDADFLRMHATGVHHCGLIYAPQHTPIGQILRGLMLIYEVLSPEDMLNHVEFL